MQDRDEPGVRQPGGGRVPGQPGDFDPVATAKDLLRTARAGSLATLDAATGHPFCTLTGVATAADGAPLMLVSRLSGHTRNLLADGRVSLLLARGGQIGATKGDPLAHPRLTILGHVQPDEDEASRRRYLARHPKAELYADFADFLFVRLEPAGAHLNGGFARAARLSRDELMTELSDAAELVEREAGAVAHMNADHAEAVALYATALLGQKPGPWRLSGLDPEGCDLVWADRAARLPFPRRVTSGDDLRAVLVELVALARAGVPGAPAA